MAYLLILESNECLVSSVHCMRVRVTPSCQVNQSMLHTCLGDAESNLRYQQLSQHVVSRLDCQEKVGGFLQLWDTNSPTL